MFMLNDIKVDGHAHKNPDLHRTQRYGAQNFDDVYNILYKASLLSLHFSSANLQVKPA